MGLNIGANSLNDIYLGGNCWDRVYKGNTLLFDAISEINGLLPIIFKSKASVALKNYHIYGTSEGAGVETESGEPAGYKISLTITSGEQSVSYSLYIGDSKLGVEEYVDFGEQKIYKMIDGTLTPTDPPISFPEILTYQGENTLSSTETLGEATIKGRIKKITLVTPDLVQGSIDYWPYTIGQKGTRTSVTTRCSTQSYITIPSKSQVYIYADKDDVVFSGCWTDTNLTFQGNIASGFAKELILKNTELSNRYIVLNSIGRMLPTDKEGSPTGTIAPSYFTITFKIMEI